MKAGGKVVLGLVAVAVGYLLFKPKAPPYKPELDPTLTAISVALTGVEIKEITGVQMFTDPISCYMGDLWEVEKINYEVVVYEKETGLGVAGVAILVQVNGKVYSARSDINGRVVSSFDAPKEPLKVSMERYAITAYIKPNVCPISSTQRFGINCILRYYAAGQLLELWGLFGYRSYNNLNLFLKSMPVVEGQDLRTELHPYNEPCLFEWRLYPTNGYWREERFYGNVSY